MVERYILVYFCLFLSLDSWSFNLLLDLLIESSSLSVVVDKVFILRNTAYYILLSKLQPFNDETHHLMLKE